MDCLQLQLIFLRNDPQGGGSASHLTGESTVQAGAPAKGTMHAYADNTLHPSIQTKTYTPLPPSTLLPKFSC
jgi:hypothetical protein